MDTTLEDARRRDALAFGAQALVDEIHDEATAWVDELCPWSGEGDEPAERVSA